MQLANQTVELNLLVNVVVFVVHNLSPVPYFRITIPREILHPGVQSVVDEVILHRYADS